MQEVAQTPSTSSDCQCELWMTLKGIISSNTNTNTIDKVGLGSSFSLLFLSLHTPCWTLNLNHASSINAVSHSGRSRKLSAHSCRHPHCRNHSVRILTLIFLLGRVWLWCWFRSVDIFGTLFRIRSRSIFLDSWTGFASCSWTADRVAGGSTVTSRSRPTAMLTPTPTATSMAMMILRASREYFFLELEEMEDDGLWLWKPTMSLSRPAALAAAFFEVAFMAALICVCGDVVDYFMMLGPGAFFTKVLVSYILVGLLAWAFFGGRIL